MYSARAGDGLQAGDLWVCELESWPWRGGTHPLLLEGGAVCTEDQLLRSCRELCQTGNGQVLVIQIRVLAEEVVGL